MWNCNSFSNLFLIWNFKSEAVFFFGGGLKKCTVAQNSKYDSNSYWAGCKLHLGLPTWNCYSPGPQGPFWRVLLTESVEMARSRGVTERVNRRSGSSCRRRWRRGGRESDLTAVASECAGIDRRLLLRQVLHSHSLPLADFFFVLSVWFICASLYVSSLVLRFLEPSREIASRVCCW
jgi:hypothetical protein